MMELIDYEKKKVTELIDFSLGTRGKEPSIQYLSKRLL